MASYKDLIKPIKDDSNNNNFLKKVFRPFIKKDFWALLTIGSSLGVFLFWVVSCMNSSLPFTLSTVLGIFTGSLIYSYIGILIKDI